MEGRRVGRAFKVVRVCALAAATGFLLLLVAPLNASAAAPSKGVTACLLGLVCTSATPTATPTATATPAPTPTGVVGTLTGTVGSTTGTVTTTVTGAVNTVTGTVNGVLATGSSPTPCVLNCTSSTPTPPPSGGSAPASGSGSTSGSSSGSSGGIPGSGAGQATPASGGSMTDTGSAASRRAALHGQLAAQSLDLAAPPSFLGFGPIPGIDFGNAPFLWPIFLALDLAAFGAVVYVIRKKGFVAKE